MADVKISALPVAASVALTDYIPCVIASGPTTKRATFTVVRAALMPIVLTADVSGVLPTANGGWSASASESLTNKTIVAASNTITDTSAASGDLFVHDGTRFVRFAMGSANTVLQVNALGTAISWDAVSIDISAVTGLGTGVGTFLTTPSGANLASALTSALPVSKGGTNRTALGSSLQVLRTNAAANDTEWATISSSGSPGGSSGEIQTNDGAGGFAGATNVLAGSGYIAVGASSASSGAVRLSVGGDITAHDSAAGYYTLIQGSGDSVYIGTNASFAQQAAGVNIYAAGATAIGVGSTTALYITGTATEAWLPLLGSSLGSTPWSVHGESPSVDMNNANYTLGATEYSRTVIKVTSTTNFTAARTLTFPAPADADHAYCKFVRNTQLGAFAVTCSTGAGTSVGIAQGRGAWMLFTTTGVVRMTADSVPT